MRDLLVGSLRLLEPIRYENSCSVKREADSQKARRIRM
jgi:hypothetical protein